MTALLALLLGCSSGSPPRALPGAPPGATPRPPAVQAAIDAAVAAFPADHQPRTRHRAPDGAALYSNRLVLEGSPYLRQHAHNPVDWFPWGDEAFQLAEELGRPVLVSVGYATCHWCHVMEEESFEDPEIAAFLNEHYVLVKVDREERPDVDALTMAAVQALTGDGGWPTTVWMTPDGQPFYAGTYFPARDGDRGAAVGFLSLVTEISRAWAEQRADIQADAGRIDAMLDRRMEADTRATVHDEQTLAAATTHWRAVADPVLGGLRGAPKFPSGLPVGLLLHEGWRTGDAELLALAEATLDGMAAGGLYDHLGGGFHRYSVDGAWRVPHFEKMLVDNARLAMLYAESAQALGRWEHGGIALETLAWIDRELSVDGGFASALDADSLGPDGQREEGRSYTWTEEELALVLSGRELAMAKARWGVEGRAEVEGRHVLHAAKTVREVADAHGLSTEQATLELGLIARQLRAARDRRPQPLRDDKLVAEWNGLAIAAFARVGVWMDRPDLVARATTAAEAVLARLWVDGRLHRSWRGGVLGPPAVLEDHAALMVGLLALFEATGDARWLQQSLRLDAAVQARFELPDGGWTRTPAGHDPRLPRERPRHDGAAPGGPSLMVHGLQRLHVLTLDDRYRQRAQAGVASLGKVLAATPWALPDLLDTLSWQVAGPREVVLTWPDGADPQPMLAPVRARRSQPLVVLPVAASAVDGLAGLAPVVADKRPRDGLPTAYVCTLGSCRAPVTDPQALGALLDAARPAAASPSTE